VRWLSDTAVARLKGAADDAPDLGGTKYELMRPLGRGGMGAVYVARDRELAREVALKVMATDDPSAAERMRQEARILARLEHPGLVPVHDVGILPDGRCFYAMKLVRGRRLDEHAAGRQGLGERLRVFEKICDAVAYAHAQGVIHRDLKPANVMVGPFGEVLVMDWGVARLRAGDGQPAPASRLPAGDGSHTLAGTVLGTPGYMSPEQARGEVERIDERSDVYGLGAILDFLVGGATEGRAAALDAVCGKAMAENPADRYASATELSKDVARFLLAQPVAAHRERPLERLGRLLTRYRTAAVLIAAYLVTRTLLAFFGHI
jgi:serine/threonine protein kinase